MPADPPAPLHVTFTPEFKRNLRHLAKKYRQIRSDLQPTLDELAGGGKPGDQVAGVRYEVFKVRAKNSNALKGKSGGYRLIYWAKSASEVVLITVYSKTEQADIAPEKHPPDHPRLGVGRRAAGQRYRTGHPNRPARVSGQERVGAAPRVGPAPRGEDTRIADAVGWFRKRDGAAETPTANAWLAPRRTGGRSCCGTRTEGRRIDPERAQRGGMRMARQRFDIGSKWLLHNQGKSALLVGGLKGVSRVEPMPGELVQNRKYPDGLLQAFLHGEPEPHHVLIEVATYPERRALEQALDDLTLAYSTLGELPELLMLVLRPKGQFRIGGQHEVRSKLGLSRLQAQWKTVELWTLPAADFLAEGDVGVVPWVPLMQFDGPPEAVLERLRSED